MSEIEALFITDSAWFVLCLFAAIWLTALVGTIYEIRRWYRNRTAYKPCKHEFTSRYGSTSELVCFYCGDIK